MPKSNKFGLAVSQFCHVTSSRDISVRSAPAKLVTSTTRSVVIPNALHQANPSPLRTSKKDSNNVTTNLSMISDHRPHQRAAIDNQRSMILITLPVQRVPSVPLSNGQMLELRGKHPLSACPTTAVNALHQANPLPIRTSKKDSNNVTTKPSVISDHRPHQQAAINNQRSMILIILPVRRMPPASPQWSTLEGSNVGAAGKIIH